MDGDISTEVKVVKTDVFLARMFLLTRYYFIIYRMYYVVCF